MSENAFLALRVVHMLLAALWLGAAVVTAFFMVPALERVESAEGQGLAALMRRGFHVYMAMLGGTTVLTGFLLYWRLTAHFDAEASRTHTAMMFGAGGLCGFVALLLGGGVVGRTVKAMAALSGELAAAVDPQRTALQQRMGALRSRASVAGRMLSALLVLALVLMALGHYV